MVVATRVVLADTHTNAVSKASGQTAITAEGSYFWDFLQPNRTLSHGRPPWATDVKRASSASVRRCASASLPSILEEGGKQFNFSRSNTSTAAVLFSPELSTRCPRTRGPLPLPVTLNGRKQPDKDNNPTADSVLLAAVMDLAAYVRQELLWLHTRVDEAKLYARAGSEKACQLYAELRYEVASIERREDHRRQVFLKELEDAFKRSTEKVEQLYASTITRNDSEPEEKQQPQEQKLQQRQQKQQHQPPLIATVMDTLMDRDGHLKPGIEKARWPPVQRSLSEPRHQSCSDSDPLLGQESARIVVCLEDFQPTTDLPQAEKKLDVSTAWNDPKPQQQQQQQQQQPPPLTATVVHNVAKPVLEQGQRSLQLQSHSGSESDVTQARRPQHQSPVRQSRSPVRQSRSPLRQSRSPVEQLRSDTDAVVSQDTASRNVVHPAEGPRLAADFPQEAHPQPHYSAPSLPLRACRLPMSLSNFRYVRRHSTPEFSHKRNSAAKVPQAEAPATAAEAAAAASPNRNMTCRDLSYERRAKQQQLRW